MFEHILIRHDILVLVVAVVLYVADVSRLLYVNEVLLVRGAASRWSATTPADGLRFARRRLVFPRFLDAGCVVLLFQWPAGCVDDPTKTVGVPDVEERLRTLLFPQHVCRLLLPEIFLGLPLAYYLAENPWPLLGLFVMIYVQIIGLVTWLFLKRRELVLPLRNCLLLTFESLICIPYAINLHRKVAELAVVDTHYDLLTMAERLLDADEEKALRLYIREAIDDRLARQGAARESVKELAALRSRLVNE